MVKQNGGGSVGQSLRYVDTAAPEQTAPAGSDLLIERGNIVRPAIGGGTRKRKGGFLPSIMTGVVDAGLLTVPLAGFTARKMWNNRSRKGGAKMEKWLVQKEEAKAILQAYGKPSAQNIQAYAMARRRGSEVANSYLEGYRKRKQEKAEANEAHKAAKAAAKAAAKRERNEKRAATKKNKPVKEKKAKKTKKNKGPTAPVVKGKHIFFNNEGRELPSTANRNKALASLAKKVASPKTPNNVRPTTPVVNRPKTPPNNVPKTKKAKKEKKVKVVNASAAPKTRRSPSEGSKKYFEALRKAREYLGTIGAPTGPNMSKYASMKMKGENTSNWEANFRTRRPLSMATTKKVRKPKAAPKSSAAKPLTAVKEENENEMQGYSENFEPESESSESSSSNENNNEE